MLVASPACPAHFGGARTRNRRSAVQWSRRCKPLARLRLGHGQRSAGADPRSLDVAGSDPPFRHASIGTGEDGAGQPHPPRRCGVAPSQQSVPEGCRAPPRGGGGPVGRPLGRRAVRPRRARTGRARPGRPMAFLPRIAGPERPPAEGWDGVHIPTLPRGTPSVQGRGSLRPRPQVPARRSRPGGRGATAIRQTACAVAGVHVRNACPRTRTPMSMCARRPAPVTAFWGRKPAFEQLQLAEGPSLREVSFAQVVRSITRGIE